MKTTGPRTLAIASGISLLFASAASATEDGFAQSGVYVGLAGSVGIPLQLDEPFEDAGVDHVEADASLGLHTRVGYRFHPRVAAEAHFEWLGGFDVSLDSVYRPDPGSGTQVATADLWTLTGDARIYLLTGEVQPYLLAGAGMLSAELKNEADPSDGLPDLSDSSSGFAARFGAGFDYCLTENFALNFDASYVMPTGAVEDFDYVSVGWGFQYRF
jgi:opacity protein-like surface antigen